ncbi:protein ALP1-like [Gigantopelta aegis]|uniref:protein ALP1-like n=1 Tax=Gigantopelta aegis TaxID=1735272 RepID=UPI001B88DB90|nr:protein ALP1-like [Gigantopelta aegis]
MAKSRLRKICLILLINGLATLPATEEEWIEVAKDFELRWNFPHCLGAIDGKHISIRKPPHSGSFYYNYKKFFSIVLMAVVNANYEFLMVDAGVNGCVSDGGVITHTDFGHMLSNNTHNIPQPAPLPVGPRALHPFTFVGDDAFAMTENLLKPYSPSAACRLDLQQRIFNYRLSRARRIVENAFGILVSRFGMLQRSILLSPEKTSTVTLACCYLHNFLRRKVASYITRESVDWEDKEGDVQDGSWRQQNLPIHDLQANTSRNSTNIAKSTRDMYRDFFCSYGAVPWQWNKCS